MKINKEKLHKCYQDDPSSYFQEWYYCNTINPNATKEDWNNWRDGMLALYNEL